MMPCSGLTINACTPHLFCECTRSAVQLGSIVCLQGCVINALQCVATPVSKKACKGGTIKAGFLRELSSNFHIKTCDASKKLCTKDQMKISHFHSSCIKRAQRKMHQGSWTDQPQIGQAKGRSHHPCLQTSADGCMHTAAGNLNPCQSAHL
jgi:hypothetical protein